MQRRTFLKTSALAGGGLALAGPLSAFGARVAHADPLTSAGYGALTPTAALNDGVTYLALPDGFSYYAFNNVGTPFSASNAALVPGAHDGMAAFAAPGGKIRIVRNHEQTYGTPFAPAGSVYDPNANGGCSIVEFDPANPGVVEAWAAISGTVRNCAGGPTPWGSWLTCEETTDGPGGNATLKHGYVFEIPADLPVGTSVAAATPLTAMGRFSHEAVAVDPVTNNVYLTEDTGASGYFKFVPAQPGVPGDPGQPAAYAAGGTLYMLKVTATPSLNTHNRTVSPGTNVTISVGTPLAVEWVPIADPDNAPYAQGRALGGAAFSRGEGQWIDPATRTIYFNATDGGAASAGQVWAYSPVTETLTLVYESPNTATLLKPDNLTVSPTGNVWLFEDTDRARQTSIKGLADDGTLFTFAENVRTGTIGSVPAAWDEFAGGCFSPDGNWLFVNIQTPGVTLAITGPFSAEPPVDVPEIPVSPALLTVAAAATVAGAAIALRGRGHTDNPTPTA